MKITQNLSATTADRDGDNVIHGAFEASYSVNTLGGITTGMSRPSSNSSTTPFRTR